MQTEFRKYLEDAGVLDAITNALIKLFELSEKPSDPVRFLKSCFDETASEEETELKKENDELNEKVASLERLVGELQEKLAIGQEAAKKI
ncbi:hypothetical protein TcWFU_004680 [Taenia crassiceps]|uniref:c-Myc-binding protein n=1 Tax=Taenia crassiceps TaxID=6207 RepID=A0ABR4Q5K6_9CEST